MCQIGTRPKNLYRLAESSHTITVFTSVKWAITIISHANQFLAKRGMMTAKCHFSSRLIAPRTIAANATICACAPSTPEPPSVLPQPFWTPSTLHFCAIVGKQWCKNCAASLLPWHYCIACDDRAEDEGHTFVCGTCWKKDRKPPQCPLKGFNEGNHKWMEYPLAAARGLVGDPSVLAEGLEQGSSPMFMTTFIPDF